jgi:hypothetical protein
MLENGKGGEGVVQTAARNVSKANLGGPVLQLRTEPRPAQLIGRQPMDWIRCPARWSLPMDAAAAPCWPSGMAPGRSETQTRVGNLNATRRVDREFVSLFDMSRLDDITRRRERNNDVARAV